jgi:hypothetical protein
VLATSVIGPKTSFFTDAPGEWFQKWALNRNSTEAGGARWVADRADVLLLEALAGESMGTARNSIQFLAQRMAAERRGRPIALIWTKADIEIAREMEATVRKAVMDPMPDAQEFAVSIVAAEGDSQGIGRGLLALFDWTLSVRREKTVLTTRPQTPIRCSCSGHRHE